MVRARSGVPGLSSNIEFASAQGLKPGLFFRWFRPATHPLGGFPGRALLQSFLDSRSNEIRGGLEFRGIPPIRQEIFKKQVLRLRYVALRRMGHGGFDAWVRAGFFRGLEGPCSLRKNPEERRDEERTSVANRDFS